MQRIVLDGEPLGAAVAAAVGVLQKGGVVLYPTDTLYGLGADAFSDEAVDKVYEIKGRDERKPMHCIVADLAMAELYAYVDNDARLLMKQLLPGALTLILKKRPHVRRGIARGLDTIGIRIPNNELCLALAREFDRPYTATSANVAGLPPARSVEPIVRQLASAAASVDLIIDAGELPPSEPSTVVDLSGEAPVILREGEIPVVDVWNTIKARE